MNAVGPLRPSSLASIRPPAASPSAMLRRAAPTRFRSSRSPLRGRAPRGTRSRRRPGRRPAASFFISGRGWGHGVGMSQWGAYGFAQRGTAYDRILATTTVDDARQGARGARARAARRRPQGARRRSSAPRSRVRTGPRSRVPAPAGSLPVRPGAEGQGRLRAGRRSRSSRPLVFLPGATPLKYGGRYRGQLQVNVGIAPLQLVNNVGLEPYLYGVVPREVPPTGPPRRSRRRRSPRARTRSVRKTGARSLRRHAEPGLRRHRAEKPSTNAAVDGDGRPGPALRGQGRDDVLLLDVGRTHGVVQDVWRAGADAVPRLGRADPYETRRRTTPGGRSRSRRRSCSRRSGSRASCSTCGRRQPLAARRLTLTLSSTKGDEVVVSGDVAQSSVCARRGSVGVPRSSADEPVEYVSRRGSRDARRQQVTLEQRGRRGLGARAPEAAPDGTVAAVIRPLVSTGTGYVRGVEASARRSRLGRAAGRLSPGAVATSLAVSSARSPRRAGRHPAPQRSSWRGSRRTARRRRGAFEARLDLVAGTYRARVLPGRGLVPGFSREVKVAHG